MQSPVAVSGGRSAAIPSAGIRCACLAVDISSMAMWVMRRWHRLVAGLLVLVSVDLASELADARQKLLVLF